MNTDNILEIGIDAKQQVFVKPEKERFVLIYTTTTGVHWDNDGLFLYYAPVEWSDFESFRHILSVTETECNCKLLITEQTIWTNIPESLKKKIIAITQL